MSPLYDVIVVGLGGVGSSAVYHLARRGHRVLGIDQFSPPHDRGSSHGETRVIRKAYFEHSGYVPLLCKAYELWRQLESEVGRKLYHQTGLIELGPTDGTLIPGVLRSAAQFNLPIETMTMQEATQRYPNIRGDDSWSVIVEQDAGYLRVEACVESHLQRAAECQADLRVNQAVVDWQADGNSVIVKTQHDTFRAASLVITVGPWAGHLLSRSGIPLTVLQKQIYWYETNDMSYHEDSGFPCFFYETPAGYFYGTPQRDNLGLKVARHSGGLALGPSVTGTHQPDRQDQDAVENFLALHLPTVTKRLTRRTGCYYTMTPDENFIVDRLPDHPCITVIAGLSGHGFKFCSVLGKIAAELATQTETGLDLRFLSIDRFKRPIDTPPTVR